MFVWEWQLMVLRRACEFRLEGYRERHSRLAEERRRTPYKGPSWIKKSEKMALVRQFIYRELDSIRHVKQRANAGPIKGGTLVLHVRDGRTHKVRPGPSIIQLIERKSNEIRQWADEKIDGTIEQSKLHEKADGLDLALEILNNPYRFLDADEKSAYDDAESRADKITNEAASRLVAREDRGTRASVAPARMPSVEELRAEGAQIIRRPITHGD